MKSWCVVMLFVVILGVVSAASAAVNPADLTVGLRYSSDFLYLVSSGEGPWLAAGYEDIGNSTSIELLDIHGDDGQRTCTEIAVTKRTISSAGVLNFGVGHDFRPNDSDDNFAMVDWCKGNLGVGVIVPLEAEDPIKVGARYQVGKATFYLAQGECGASMANYGISYLAGPVKLQAAYGDGTFYFRAGKASGTITPEIRTKFDGDDTTVELAVGICR